MNAHLDANCNADAVYINSDGLVPIALPEAPVNNVDGCSYTGVSTNSAHPINGIAHTQSTNLDPAHWYALRTAYGREKKAYDYLIQKGIEAFYPTITITKKISDKIEIIEKSRIPNMFFAYGSFDTLKEYVYDNFHEETKHLRFYYQHHHEGVRILKRPLIVPDSQIRNLMIICNSNDDNITLYPFPIDKFTKGQRVRIIDGLFKGVEGVVARFKGQQRVGIVIEDLLTMTTAYVPSAFLSVEE